ncbi:3'-to-5' exoribonuclease RNase R [Fulvivirga imtechensis AK7]|uniref:Ribonuclease R n=1 Tax=Fulvivirga imtechensis AK7 TaxID=1237149 RepID=L8JZX4_9BACT|nr:ribonuclease R [Fulvivirga imtechensis]ELR73703.1 3'-to-5' exoribonuclease RNase R [Fulvivirga imtechensis AK7]
MSQKRKKKKSGKSGGIQERLRAKILSLLNSNPGTAFSIKQITKKLGFRRKDYNREIPYVLMLLQESGKIVHLGSEKYSSSHAAEVLIGKIDHVNPRFAYLLTPDDREDIYIKTTDLNYAMDGDLVKVKAQGPVKGRKPEGKVIEIIERAKDQFVGRIEFSPRFAFVIADNRKIYQDIFVKLDATKGAAHNDKVIVKITEWPGPDRSPEGEVINVLGPAGDNEAEIHSIMAEFDLPFEFPQHVEKEAEKISEKITKQEIEKRKDFRDVLTFTIDPEDAKDFDDALSFKNLENGNFEIGVHIADVTHYVQPGTILEQEAFDRATSVYLVDRTVPMLPERLSNGLCSLRPKEDKLTFAAVFEMDEEANVIKEWFGRTIIHSDRRFTYEEAQGGIETGVGDYAKELQKLNDLAKKLRKERFNRGAVNFETTEVKFKLDEKGKPLGVIPKVRKDAHKLIEEFMLLANKKVATFVFGMKKGEDKNTFVYRTHDFPDPEKVGTFAQFAKRFGHELKTDQGAISQSLNKLMTSIEGKPEENVLQQLAIRSMAKAKYTTEATGHFGLAFPHYTHFTSPIRRYPDMMVHRLLQHYLSKGKSADKNDYEEKCIHSSEREKRAADAERASIKYKQVEFMQSVEDRPFDGIISGVTEWGIYVEIVETKCEGMVRMVDLKDDYYEFDEDNYRIIGRRNKKMYTLGDKVVVTVKNTDIDRRTIDLEFAEKDSKS